MKIQQAIGSHHFMHVSVVLGELGSQEGDEMRQRLFAKLREGCRIMLQDTLVLLLLPRARRLRLSHTLLDQYNTVWPCVHSTKVPFSKHPTREVVHR
jgi:hypothetical protein